MKNVKWSWKTIKWMHEWVIIVLKISKIDLRSSHKQWGLIKPVNLHFLNIWPVCVVTQSAGCMICLQHWNSNIFPAFQSHWIQYTYTIYTISTLDILYYTIHTILPRTLFIYIHYYLGYSLLYSVQWIQYILGHIVRSLQ